MERNDTEKVTAETNPDPGGSSCGSRKHVLLVVAIWVFVTLGFASFMAYTHYRRIPETERLMRQAMALYDREDLKGCADRLKRAAELGDPQAQFYYAGSLKKGIGADQDMPAAVEWLRKSADQNFVLAFYELGVCCENGEGAARDLDQAAAWYRKAAEGGFVGPEALQALERVAKLKAAEDLNAVDGPEAVESPETVESPEARAERLMRQAQELYDTNTDDVACADLLRQAAELGNAGAQLYYGRFLCKGIGTALDPVAAVEWFRKSAAQDCAAAFYELGVCYENGEGVKKDLDAALEWYRKALDGGIAETQSSIIRVEKAKALKAAEEK